MTTEPAKGAYCRGFMYFLPNASSVPTAELAALDEDGLREVVRECMAAERSALYRLNPSIIVRQVGEETILVPTGDLAQLSNSMISVNETAAFLLEQFREPSTLQSALEATAREFEPVGRYQELELSCMVQQWTALQILLRADGEKKE